jgi:hypothetical protein
VVSEVEREARFAALGDLRAGLAELQATQDMTPRVRGKRFEGWLGDLFRIYKLDPTLDVVNDGEQIDFTFWKGDLFVVGEARWRTEAVEAKDVRDFFGKLTDRPSFAIGLMISISGFTEPALQYIGKHSGERAVLTLTGAGLEANLSGQPELSDWLDQALRARLEHP